MLELRHWITRDMLQAEPDKLFVFGDNAARRGLGGQAKELRGEPNAVGIITKIAPSNKPGSFLSDEYYTKWWFWSQPDFCRLFGHVANRGVVVWPQNGIGTGLAQLPQRAPMIADTIYRLRRGLEANRVGGGIRE